MDHGGGDALVLAEIVGGLEGDVDTAFTGVVVAELVVGEEVFPHGAYVVLPRYVADVIENR